MRVLNRLFAFALAIGVVFAATVGVIEVIAQRAHRRPVLLDWPEVHSWATRTSWGAAPVLLLSIGLIVVGLLLLVAQLTPRRPARLPITAGNPATDAAITRGGLAHTLRRAVTDVDGVSRVHVRARRHRARISASTRATDIDAVRATLTETAQRQLDALHLSHPPTLSVRVTTREP
ncbi:DUF6286 domain-containing protein [Nucisporomicrobium flavum]|uniref:DUF6286 domain-containing protein n=1 Tax=Nucisporomicrobium flavum TaxID=2785915 RepID=UPI0018F6AE8B|nr:DUF6286 domain-containing protein [Nucisporomicrobium flavum]